MGVRAVLILALAVAGPAAAADPAPAGPTDPSSACVDVTVGAARAPDLACLNARLKDHVASAVAARSQAMPSLDATSSDPALGVANVAAWRLQMGPNAGNSVRPYRPAPSSIPSSIPNK